jgi:capsular exopolysaccharide synthesis family protein
VREGKSTLARHLAARLARSGKKTLLVDADLYRPTAHAAYRLPAGPGLCELMCGTSIAALAIQPTRSEGLNILTAGVVSPAAFQEMARGAFGPVLEDLRTAYEVIIIDTSPVLATAQPLLLGRLADAVVLSTLSAVSRAPRVAETSLRLSDLGITLAGVVVNGTTEASQYGYYFRPEGRRRAIAEAGN